MLLNNEWVINEIKEEIKWYLETNENENVMTQNQSMRHSESNPKREIHNNPGLPQETSKSSNKQSNLTLKRTRTRRANKAQSI